MVLILHSGVSVPTHRFHTPFVRALLLLAAGMVLPLLWPGMVPALFGAVEPEHWHQSATGALDVLHVGSDVLTFLSYTAIATMLAFLVYRNRHRLPFDWVVLCFGLFIVACGFTHIMHVFTRFYAVQGLDTYIRALTAIVSLVTAVAFIPLMPRITGLLEAQQLLGRKKQELEDSNRLFKQQQRELQKSNLDLQEARDLSEFHAALSDLLQAAHHPDTLAERALEKLGPALKAEQVTLIRIQQERARLWHAWGDFIPARIAFLAGEGTPLEELQLLNRVVQSGKSFYTNHYSDTSEVKRVAEHPIAAAFEPILNREGLVVAVLAFSRPEHQGWQEHEQQIAGRAAFTLSLALQSVDLLEQLNQSQQALAEAKRKAPVAELVADVQGQILWVNPAACTMLGYTEQELLALTPELLYHPEDIQNGLANLQSMRDDLPAITEVERRYLHKNGTVLWVQLHMSLLRDAKGQPHRLIMQFSDITRRKLTEQERDQAQRYSLAQEQISRLLEKNITPEEMARDASRIVAETAGLDYTGLITVHGDLGEVSTVFVSPQTTPTFRHAMVQPVPRGTGLSWRCLEERRPHFVDHHLDQSGANPIFVEAGVTAVAYFPLIIEGNTISKPLVFVACWLNGKTRWSDQDRTLMESAARTIRVAVERQEHLIRLEQAAHRDALTGLGNRRAFESDLKTEHARSRRHAQPLAVMILDLDGLKKVNDQSGHEAGDRLLCSFATHLQKAMRTEDRCYRLGGDEFAVLLAHCPLESQEHLHLRIQAMMQQVRQEGFADSGVSAGLAFFPDEALNTEDLVRLADQRMYQMKAQHQLKPD